MTTQHAAAAEYRWRLPVPFTLFNGPPLAMPSRISVLSFWVVLSIAPWFASRCQATRFIAFIPQSAGDPPAIAPDSPANNTVSVTPGAQSGDSQWADYVQAWQQHARNPADMSTRQRLRLPAQEPVNTTTLDVRSVARLVPKGFSIDWVAPQGIETDHFLLIADVPEDAAREIAIDLESFYAVWTQLFFPLWKERQRWDQPQPRANNRPLAPRGPSGPFTDKMRVLVLRDVGQYQKALKAEGPQISQSTGYYSGNLRTTFLLHTARDTQSAATSDESRATRYHELTHQLLAEATDTKLKMMPGERSGFWLAEGIACYMESTFIHHGYATIGGWESSRLQFARHRALSLGEAASIDTIQSLGRLPFQRHRDLTGVYSLAAAESHRIIDENDGAGLNEMISQLSKLYQIRRAAPKPQSMTKDAVTENDLQSYLTLNDQSLTPITRNDLINLCLARCTLQSTTLARIPPQQNLVWLDLTAIKVSTEDVVQLCPQVGFMRQLSLEATLIDDSIATWLARATALEELDLSWTGIGDSTLAAISADAPLQTLWLTGSTISDVSIDRIIAWRSLRRVDLQRTKVTDAGRARLVSARPDLTVDPLELVSEK